MTEKFKKSYKLQEECAKTNNFIIDDKSVFDSQEEKDWFKETWGGIYKFNL